MTLMIPVDVNSLQQTLGLVVLTNLGELPFYRSGFPVRIVVSHSNGSQIGKQGEEDDQIDADGFVEDDHGQGEVDLEMEAKRDTVF